MDTVRIAAGELEARFAPAAGMICCSLLHAGEELLGQRRGLEVYAERGKTMGIPLLHPWANRLGAWTYSFGGRDVDLHGARVGTDGATGLPIHGLLPRAWRVESHEAGRIAAVLDPAGDEHAFPFPHRARLVASLSPTTLWIETAIEPAQDGPVPVAFGFHPYLTLPGVAREDYRLELPVRRRLVLDGRRLPTGQTEPAEPYVGALGSRSFDDGFDRLDEAPFAASGGGRRLELRFEGGFTVAQVFAPPGEAFVCFEPMTAPADALRTGAAPLAAPGEPYRAAFALTVAATVD